MQILHHVSCLQWRWQKLKSRVDQISISHIVINHRSLWAMAAVVCDCSNRFLCLFFGPQVLHMWGRKISRPAAQELKVCRNVPSGHHWNTAHHTITRNITEIFSAGGVIIVMRLSLWRHPRVTGDSQDRWCMPPAMEITVGNSHDFQEV